MADHIRPALEALRDWRAEWEAGGTRSGGIIAADALDCRMRPARRSLRRVATVAQIAK